MASDTTTLTAPPAHESDGDEDDTLQAAPQAGAAEARGLITLRRPTYRDGAAMWRLVKESGALDENSPYAYLMMGEWFAETCLVAEERFPGGARRMAGFVMGFVPPNQPDTVFVWQVGVDKRQRGRGMGKRLISEFVRRAPHGVRYLEATVTPSNAASEALFRAVARDYGAHVRVSERFSADAFPGQGHEAERLFRIGPIEATASRRTHVEAFEKYESNVRSYIRAFPEVFVSAKGARVTGRSGREYIDFFAGAGALNYGHNDEGMKQKLLDYVASDGIAHSLDMATDAKERFLKRFNEVILAPRGMSYKMMFPGPTGTNAVESALKLARKVTGREKVVSFTNAFHGMTLGSLAVTGNAFKRSGAGLPLDNTIFMPYDSYMGDGWDSLDYFERTLEDGGSGIDLPAAVIVETVQGEGGINACSMDWLKRLEALCRRWEMLLIVDDIQAGCGRTGTFFSFEDAGIEPDLICLSKSLSGYGLPLAVVLIKPEHDQFAAGEHNGTFRGNNMAFVTATEALRFWENKDLEQAVKRKATIIRESLEEIAQAHPEMEPEVRGRGFMQGIALNSGDTAAAVCGEAFARGVIMETSGPDGEVVKLLAPLTISEDDLRAGLGILKEAFATVARDAAGDETPAKSAA